MPQAKPDDRCLALGQNIKKLREKKHLSQEKLSEKADIHVSYIGQIERGLRYPSLKTLFRIADALDVRINDIFKGIYDVRRNGKEDA
ncbi:MAG: helix-turn-helix transcriptional regulator [Nitrospirota bacterium]|jgi:transcriptional regulator with XRE-family HTH domain